MNENEGVYVLTATEYWIDGDDQPPFFGKTELVATFRDGDDAEKWVREHCPKAERGHSFPVAYWAENSTGGIEFRIEWLTIKEKT